MFLSPSFEVRVETAGNDVSYLLPARPIGKLRLFGLIPVAFSLLFIAMPARSLVDFLRRIAAGNGDIGNWLFVLFLSAFVVVGLFPLRLGVLIICGRCRVDWRQRRLSVTDYAGPIRWRRRLPRGPIRKFTVAAGGMKVNDKPVTSGPLANLGALTAEFEQGKPRMVVLGYPRDWLQALAQDLSTRVGASVSTAVPPEIELVNARANPPELADVIEKPPNSQVRAEPKPNGLLLVVPPAGLRKGSKGLFAFGIFWCLFMAVFTCFMVFANGDGSNGPTWFVWVFVSGFWLIGLSLLAGALNMGRRRAMLLVENGELRVAQDGLFGAKRWTLRRGELAAIRADASGMAVNDVPIIELQIHPVSGKKLGFFAGRDEQELRWMATELRQALKVPASSRQD